MNSISNALTYSILVSLFYIACSPADSVALQSSEQTDKPLKVLMLISEHNYDLQIQEGLMERIGNIEFTIDDGVSVADRAEEFDLVIYNHCQLDLEDEEFVGQMIAAHVEHQVPAVLLHCPIRASQNAAEKWFEFAGAVSYVLENANRPLIIETLEPHHPLMVNFPRTWRSPEDELLFIIELMENAQPLARAFSEVTESYHEVAWTNKYEGVRIFSNTLGHTDATMVSDVNLNLIAAGLLWSADKLEEDGTPSPGYEGERGLGWLSLWDGETLNGWRASEVTDWADWTSSQGEATWPSKENPGTDSFWVQGDHIIVSGPESNLFYEGAIAGGDFRNFEFKSDIYSFNNSLSGIFFHTRYQDYGIPKHGHKVQFYARGDEPQGEHDWFSYYVKMENGDLIPQVEIDLPSEITDPEITFNRGTIALHSSSPNSRFYFRNLLIRLWPD